MKVWCCLHIKVYIKPGNTKLCWICCWMALTKISTFFARLCHNSQWSNFRMEAQNILLEKKKLWWSFTLQNYNKSSSILFSKFLILFEITWSRKSRLEILVTPWGDFFTVCFLHYSYVLRQQRSCLVIYY